MAEYQNLFTAVQPSGALHHGVPLGKGNEPRFGQPAQLHLLGRLGNAQIGPIYLGTLGVAATVCFSIAFLIVGLNMLASVGWDPVQFVRQLFWLALEPPAPEYGLKIPPMNEGGWFLVTGLFLTSSIMLWWLRVYRRARELHMGTHVAWPLRQPFGSSWCLVYSVRF